MQQLVYDFLLYFWEQGLYLPMPIRAIVIVIISISFLSFIMISLVPRILKIILTTLDIVISFISEYIIQWSTHKLCRIKFIKDSKLIYGFIKVFDNLFVSISDLIQWGREKLSTHADVLAIIRKKLKVFIIIIQLIFIVWLALPYLHDFHNTRIEKYIDFAFLKWNIVENRINEISGLKTENIANFRQNGTSQKIKYFKLNSKGINGANIREKPNLKRSTKIVYVVTGVSVKLKYLEQSQVDDNGRLWYLVETSNNKKGWISSRIVIEIK